MVRVRHLRTQQRAKNRCQLTSLVFGLWLHILWCGLVFVDREFSFG
jgi:hypothetical protein